MIKIAAFARFELGAVKGNEAEVKRKQEDFKVARNKWSVGGPIEEEKKLVITRVLPSIVSMTNSWGCGIQFRNAFSVTRHCEFRMPPRAAGRAP